LQQAPLVDRELKAKLLRRACDIVGTRERLAAILGVEMHSLEFWMSGRATPPERIFMSVVDLVLEDDIARAAQDRRKNAVQRSVFGTFPERATGKQHEAKA
jgi:DNA-binding transcriptional regulator YdaS (Cro superfamily)